MLLKNKRPFLLLEVLIALFIVVVCISPLLTSQVFMYKVERQFLHKLELDRVANIVFTDILKNLYEKNEIFWSDIQDNKKFTYDPQRNPKNGIPSHFPYHITYSVGMTKYRKPKDKPTNFLVLLTITITPSDKSQNPNIYHYKVFISKQTKEGEATPINEMRDITAPSVTTDDNNVDVDDDDNEEADNEN